MKEAPTDAEKVVSKRAGSVFGRHAVSGRRLTGQGPSAMPTRGTFLRASQRSLEPAP